MTVNDAVVEAKDAAAIARSNATDGMDVVASAAAATKEATLTAATAVRKTSRKNSATEALARLGGKKF